MEKKVKRKIAENDFLIEQLPQTRKDQFIDVLKINFLTLFKIGLILLGIFLPLLIKVAVEFYLNDMINVSFFELKTITEIERNTLLIYILVGSGLVNIILFPLIFVILSGILRIIRQLCYTEGVLFSYDFKKGVKENWKKFLGVGIILGIIYSLNITLYAFLGFNFLTVIALVISLLVLVPGVLTSTYFFSTYENKFWRGLFNSILIYLRSPWKMLLLTVIIIAPVAVLEIFLNGIIIKLLIYISLIIFVLPIVLLLGYEFCLSSFDKYVNIYHFKDSVRKGLYVPNSEKENMNKDLNEIQKECK